MTSFSSASVTPLSRGPSEVPSELFGVAAGDERGDCDEAAVALGQLGTFPDVTEQDVVGERHQLSLDPPSDFR